MTLPRVLLALLFLTCLIWFAVDHHQLVSPGPDNESAFLKSYTPAKVIDQFKAVPFSEQSVGSSSGAEREFATHQADFEPTLVIKTGDWVALMQALRDDVTSRLTALKCQIVEESGSPADGFKIKYAIGKSQGTVILDPVRSAPNSLPSAAPGPDQSTVKLRIQINEKWFKAGAHPITAQLRAESF